LFIVKNFSKDWPNELFARRVATDVCAPVGLVVSREARVRRPVGALVAVAVVTDPPGHMRRRLISGIQQCAFIFIGFGRFAAAENRIYFVPQQ
jgi:hypothetical protein